VRTFAARKITGKPRIKESDIQRHIKAHLELRGWLVIETHGPFNRPAHEGITDLIAVKYGFTVWIECKRPTWKPCEDWVVISRTESKEREFRSNILCFGGTYALIKNFDEAEDDIKALDAKADKYKNRRVTA
jgi:hypothetical protein